MAKKEIPQIVPVTEPEYSLLTEPWLKVVTKNGEVKNYGLYGLFENLDNVSSLLVDVEMEDPAIFRMLLAIMYRALDPVLVDDWKTWWSEGSLPVDRILDYLKESVHQLGIPSGPPEASGLIAQHVVDQVQGLFQALRAHRRAGDARLAACRAHMR